MRDFSKVIGAGSLDLDLSLGLGLSLKRDRDRDRDGIFVGLWIVVLLKLGVASLRGGIREALALLGGCCLGMALSSSSSSGDVM